MDPHPIFCEKCGAKLNPKTAVWLEYDQRIPGPTRQPVPPEFSQGCFAYGPDCARTIR